MSGIRVNPDQFLDIVVDLLLDMLMHPDEVMPDNEEFKYLIKKMKGGGLQSPLLSYYIDTSVITRGKWKMIRDSFTGKSNSNSIFISGKPDGPPVDDKTTIKNIVKQTLKLIKFAKDKRNGIPLSEEIVDKLIDKVLLKLNERVE